MCRMSLKWFGPGKVEVRGRGGEAEGKAEHGQWKGYAHYL